MRTGTVSYKLEDLKKGVIIPIGFVGENDFTRVIFDAEEIYKKFPNASVSMKVQPPKGGIYPATVTRDGNAVIWQVKEADVANRGGGELQLTFTDGETKIKTYIARTDVKRSLAGNGPAPDPVQDWVDNAEEVLDDLAAMDNIAKNAEAGDVGKALSPKTVENGVVIEWQFVEPGAGTDDYADLDNKPSIAGVTLSGNKTLEDLGIAADDDLDNLADEVSDVKSTIQGKYTKPSGGIPATDLAQAVQTSLSAADSALIGVGKSEERDGIVQTGDTATRNITKDQYVIWKGNLYTASANIATGETLSLSNLDPVSDGGFNALHDEIEQKHRIKAYKKVTFQEQVDGQWVELDEIVDIEDGDEIEIIIYQSDTSQGTKWSNSDQWNACALQNRSGTMSINIPYLNGTKPVEIIIKKAQGYATSKTITNNGIQLYVSFPNDFDNFRRLKIAPSSSTSTTYVAGCTVVITVRKTI